MTGGLTFAGGPWNNYVGHAIATMTGRLRDDPGSVGLCSALGGYFSKHAVGLYSTEPPRAGFRHAKIVEVLHGSELRSLAETHDGEATFEVLHGDARPHRRAGEGHRRLPAPRRPPHLGDDG